MSNNTNSQEPGMGSDVIDFMEYMRQRPNMGRPTIGLDDLRAFCQLDDAAVTWISSLFAFARYTLFLKTLFLDNNGGTGHKNTGFLVGFADSHLERMVGSICSGLEAMNRPYRLVDATNKTYIEIANELAGGSYSSNYAAGEAIRTLLYESDEVIVIRAFSLSKSPRKAGSLRDWIKTLDDAHIHGVAPRSDLLLIDYGSFLQKAWPSIGPYLSILAYSEDQADLTA